MVEAAQSFVRRTKVSVDPQLRKHTGGLPVREFYVGFSAEMVNREQPSPRAFSKSERQE